MGVFDRLEKIAEGFVGAAVTPFGFGKDLITAPFVDDDIDGVVNTVRTHFVDRYSEGAADLFGPDTGVGAIIGAIPEKQIRKPVNKAFEALEWTYREGIAEPVATAQYVNQATSPASGGSWSALFDSETWRKGHENAQDTSVGQNFAYGAMGVGLDDDRARAEAEDSAIFTPLSGSVDAAMRLFADPTVVLGVGVGAARKAVLVKPITAKTDLDAVAGSDSFGKFNAALDGKTAGEIRDQFFPNDINGPALATALAEAGSAGAREKVLRLAMGDDKQLQNLYLARAEVAGQIERMLNENTLLRSLDEDHFAKVNARSTSGSQLSLFDEQGAPSRLDPLDDPSLDEDFGAMAALDEMPTEVERTEMELQALYDEEERLLRRDAIFGQIRNQPRARLIDQARVGVTRSQFYQKSIYAAPVRATFNMRPKLLLDLHDPAGDVNVAGYLRKAGLDKDEQDVWRERYMSMPSPEGRAAVALEMEDAVIARLAEENGLSRSELETIMKKVNKGRDTARQTLASRSYDGEGRSLVRYKDDDGVMHEYPLYVTQTANVLPLGDMEQARKAMTEWGEFKRRHPGTQLPTESLDLFTRYWKPSVLLRPGWPIRVVTDEQMRIMGKVGVLAQLSNLGPGIANKAANSLARTTAVATRGIDPATGKPMSREKAASLAPEQRIGFGTEQIAGYEIPKVFGTDVKNPNPAFELTASKPTFSRLFTDVERTEVNKMREMTKDYHSVHPIENASEFPNAWANAVNRQIGQDPLARLFLADGTVDDAKKWLSTPEGRAHQRRLPYRRRNVDGWLHAMQDQIESYTMGNAAIKQAALAGKASMDDLRRIEPDASRWPIVHGGVLDDAMDKGIISTFFGNFIEKAYTALGSMPSDALSRHPFADHMYRAEATRLTTLLDKQRRTTGERLTADDLTLIEKRSREYAINETKRLLYDLAEQSDLAGSLRFLSPFYSAWQETLTRWAGIAVENPAYVARVAQVWHAPERAGIVTDENGNTITSQETGEQIRYPDGTLGTVGKERYITMKVPKWAGDILGMEGIKTQGEVTFNKKSFNMVLQGNPGVGVPVQIPVNEIVKDRPDLADSVKVILPFGPNQNSLLQAVMPAAAKRLATRQAGEEDDVFRNAALRIWTDSVVDYNTGKRDARPTWNEAVEKAKSFYAMRTVASYVSPAAPGFRSPYQPYIDAYRRLREEDIVTADQRFLDMYGEEFFPITQAFTKSADGVPPTVAGFKARSKYKDLIEQAPELGALIVGEEGSGEYAGAIYQYQKANKVKSGSQTNQRYGLTFEEVEKGTPTRLGWMEYRKLADTIEAERIARGLPNLQVAAAQDLSDLKRAAIEDLAQQYPAWYEEFGKVDRNAMAKRLVAMRAIAFDPRMDARPEMQGIREYFEVREVVRAELLARRDAGFAGSLDAAANQDIAQMWDTITADIVERNLAFADTFYRYLERDDLSAE